MASESHLPPDLGGGGLRDSGFLSNNAAPGSLYPCGEGTGLPPPLGPLGNEL